ncbi:hypothetical protein [Shinella sp.]|uniref:hypothetical protein n=1 Tax=Shinella sp. TaxID=1870904 RepID=UPI003F703C31
MFEEASTWHYAVAFVLFLILGAVGHVCRAVFNVLPDRLSDKPMLDLMISDGYNMDDHILGTEYDDAGYYRLDSWRNFRNSTLGCGFTGIAVMLCSEGASGVIAHGIETGFAWLWDLFLYRLQTLRWL